MFIRHSYKILEPHLDSLVMDVQAYLDKDENLSKIYSVIKSICKHQKYTELSDTIAKTESEVKDISGSYPRWERIKRIITKQGKKGERIWELVRKELAIGLLYPKIDSHVSAQANHLLKCPFNVHHDTGKLSLPILDVENFDVSKCLTIFDVLENKDRLAPYLAAFDEFCRPLVHNYA